VLAVKLRISKIYGVGLLTGTKLSVRHELVTCVITFRNCVAHLCHTEQPFEWGIAVEMFRRAYAPGDPVPDKILFWVHHYQHRLPHLGQTIMTVFPPCATCGDKVRYEPVVVGTPDEAMFLRFDTDFKSAWNSGRPNRARKKAAR
jgi:hypothetical protein